MSEINLLKFYPSAKRPIEERGSSICEEDRSKASKFDVEYFYWFFAS